MGRGGSRGSSEGVVREVGLGQERVVPIFSVFFFFVPGGEVSIVKVRGVFSIVKVGGVG